MGGGAYPPSRTHIQSVAYLLFLEMNENPLASAGTILGHRVAKPEPELGGFCMRIVRSSVRGVCVCVAVRLMAKQLARAKDSRSEKENKKDEEGNEISKRKPGTVRSWLHGLARKQALCKR